MSDHASAVIIPINEVNNGPPVVDVFSNNKEGWWYLTSFLQTLLGLYPLLALILIVILSLSRLCWY